MMESTQEKGNTILGTLSIEQTDLQQLHNIANRRGTSEQKIIHEWIEEAESNLKRLNQVRKEFKEMALMSASKQFKEETVEYTMDDLKKFKNSP